VICSVFGLAGIVGYIAGWIIMPEEPKLALVPSSVQQSVEHR
jgi:phage shock protein PspC (stress-responsive transcriptional regulator)